MGTVRTNATGLVPGRRPDGVRLSQKTGREHGRSRRRGRTAARRFMKGDIMKAMPRDADSTFTPEEQAAVYKCIFNRRDVRGQFLADPIPDAVLGRILRAAH